jgi:hypothetical protein
MIEIVHLLLLVYSLSPTKNRAVGYLSEPTIILWIDLLLENPFHSSYI